MGVATIALIIAIVSLVFLVFDFPKPKILMGDTGSTFLGFLIATSMVSISLMTFYFPRYETLEAAVTARIAQGWTPQATGEERHKDV